MISGSGCCVLRAAGTGAKIGPSLEFINEGSSEGALIGGVALGKAPLLGADTLSVGKQAVKVLSKKKMKNNFIVLFFTNVPRSSNNYSLVFGINCEENKK